MFQLNVITGTLISACLHRYPLCAHATARAHTPLTIFEILLGPCTSINESKTKVLTLGDNPPHVELIADRTRLPLQVVHGKQPGLTIDSSLSFKADVKSICHKVNVKVAAIRRVSRRDG